jgi:uncharacterized coiled-coil DUF342 family protein
MAVTGCGGDDAAVDEQPDTDQVSERVEELALEARRIQEDTVETGRELVEQPEDRDEARERLEELAGEARDLREEVRQDAPDAPEAESLERAARRVERGAEQLMTFAESERENLVATARESLNEADQELDGVADSLDTRLGDDARDELESLRREVPELPAP